MNAKSNVVMVDFNEGAVETAKDRKNRLAREKRAAKRKAAKMASVVEVNEDYPAPTESVAVLSQPQPAPTESVAAMIVLQPEPEVRDVAIAPHNDRLYAALPGLFKSIRAAKMVAVQSGTFEANFDWASQPGRRAKFQGVVSYTARAFELSKRSGKLTLDFDSLNRLDIRRVLDLVEAAIEGAGLSATVHMPEDLPGSHGRIEIF